MADLLKGETKRNLKDQLQSWSERLGHSVFRVRKMQFKLIPVFPWTVLGVTGQTPFTYLAHVMDLNFIRGVGEKSC